jgi:DNA mismatch endonuclease (patch repair protein)
MDVHTPEQRSRNMSAIRGKDTKPEMVVRCIVHALGYRYRLHRRDLPGAPDLVFPRLHKIINVHGCFWHMHSCSYGSVTPKSNRDFWQTKRTGNVSRDQSALRRLRADGWDVLTVWECETKNNPNLKDTLRRFLNSQVRSLRREWRSRATV